MALAVSTVAAPSPTFDSAGDVAARAPEVGCAACIVVADTGEVLWAREPDAERANASTTKMVTALVAVRSAAGSERVAVSAGAAATGGGGLDLRPGQVLTVEELLYALLLSSSNDAAVALAEHVAGSEDAFVELMNDYALDLGLRHTHFETSHGLDVGGHYSSARDLARIARAVLRAPRLAPIVATRGTTIGGVAVDNRNLLLETYRGAIGVKTGYTALAGNVLVAAADRGGRRVIAVAMGSADSFADATELLDHGFARLARGILVRRGVAVGSVVTVAGSVVIVTQRSLRGLTDPREVTLELKPVRLSGPIATGTRVGTVQVMTATGTVGAVAAVAADSVEIDARSSATDALAGLLGTAHRTASWVGDLW